MPSLIKKEYPDLYARLEAEKVIHYEMELDDPQTIRSLRISIGDLQYILALLCQQQGVKFHFNYECSSLNLSEVDIVILS